MKEERRKRAESEGMHCPTFALRPHALHSSSVRKEGLEPAHLSAPDPKSGVSTNSTTSAKTNGTAKVVNVEQILSLILKNVRYCAKYLEKRL